MHVDEILARWNGTTGDLFDLVDGLDVEVLLEEATDAYNLRHDEVNGDPDDEGLGELAELLNALEFVA